MGPLLDNFIVERPNNIIPRLRPGYFYIQDRSYYLYERKATAQLKDITWTRFKLDFIIIPGTEVVAVNGLTIPNTQYRLRGQYLEIRHSDPFNFATTWASLNWDNSRWGAYNAGIVFDPSDELTISGKSWLWDSTRFNLINIPQSFFTFGDKLKTETFYEFVTIPLSNTPVVITDDSIERTDQRDQSVEFSVDYTTGELKFNRNTNLLFNSDFSLVDNTFPSFWDLSSVTPDIHVDSFSNNSIFPVAGKGYLQIDAGNSFVSQTVSLPKDVYSLSAFVSAAPGKEIKMETSFLEEDFTFISTQEFKFSGSGDWQRVVANFASSSFTTTVWDSIQQIIPPKTDKMVVKLWGNTTTNILWDAIQLENNPFATDYTNISPLSTIEYELGNNGFYEFDSLLTFDIDGQPIGNDFPLERIDTNPFIHSANTGFLYLYEYNSIPDFQLGKGGIQVNVPSIRGELLSGLTLPITINPETIITLPLTGLQDNTKYRLELVISSIGIGTLSGNFIDGANDPNPKTVFSISSFTAAGLFHEFEFVTPVLGNGNKELRISWDGIVQTAKIDNISLQALIDITSKQGRMHLPYAKTEGKNKLSQQQTFNLFNRPFTKEVTEIGNVPTPLTMTIRSPFGEITSGFTTVNGIQNINKRVRMRVGDIINIYVQIEDNFGNAIGGETITLNIPNGEPNIKIIDNLFPTNSMGLKKFQVEALSVTPISQTVLVKAVNTNIGENLKHHSLLFEVIG